MTVDEFIGVAAPCNVGRVRTIGRARERWTAMDVLSLSDVTAEDKLWVALRPELISDRTLRLFACDCAHRALMREREKRQEPDQRLWDAVEVTRRFVDGSATRSELYAATAAAMDAAMDAYGAAYGAAAWAAAWAASGAAAMDAAWAAAWAAAWDAARDAARDDARDAARDAEMDWQVERLVSLLGVTQ